MSLYRMYDYKQMLKIANLMGLFTICETNYCFKNVSILPLTLASYAKQFLKATILLLANF